MASAVSAATSLCEDCVRGYRIPGQPAGEMVDVGSQKAYLHVAPRTKRAASGPAGSTKGKSAVVILTDVFGLPVQNPKIIADSLSRKLGVDVYVPDIFNGSPPMNEESMVPYQIDTPGVEKTWRDRLGFFWLILMSLPGIIANRPAVLVDRTKQFLTKLREEKEYSKIGVVGYCLGGTTTILIAGTTLADAAVIAHPGPTTIADVKALKVPTSWACAEEDSWFPTEFRNECEAVMRTHPEKLPFELKEYKGTTHGFACRPNQSIPAVKQAYTGALQQTADWFAKTLDVVPQHVNGEQSLFWYQKPFAQFRPMTDPVATTSIS